MEKKAYVCCWKRLGSDTERYQTGIPANYSQAVLRLSIFLFIFAGKIKQSLRSVQTYFQQNENLFLSQEINKIALTTIINQQNFLNLTTQIQTTL